eukprot:277147-Karenia_brevis.AAC.1
MVLPPAWPDSTGYVLDHCGGVLAPCTPRLDKAKALGAGSSVLDGDVSPCTPRPDQAKALGAGSTQ